MRLAWTVAALVGLALPAPAWAQGPSAEGAAAEAGSPAPSPSRATGLPNRGRLRDGVELAESATVQWSENGRSAHYGTAELVGLIERAAAKVAVAHPGAVTLVGDLSRRSGGPLHPHRSHRNGRDADIAFFLRTEGGEPTTADRFVNLRRSGCGTDGERRLCFDAERSWTLVAALVQDPIARVQYVLVAPDIRRRLLEEGERRRAPAAVKERVRIVTEPHQGSRAHRSHFHVRLYCHRSDRPGCWDEPPFHAWVDGEPTLAPGRVRRARARQRARARARRARIRARQRERA
ncbi:MAG: penicillin-insensitive murein endopeptidase, partial [Sandaracinaceae bacterium]